MARRVLLTAGGRADVGERLLGSKLQILSGTGNRRPSIALSILTGRVAEQLSILEHFYADDPAVVDAPEPAPVVAPVKLVRPHLLARTVYLTESHMRDIDTIIDAWQPGRSRRLTRSAVLRRAIEHLRGAVEADPATSLLESE
ncbi:MAG: hypothetical protein JO020_22200 [Chloroflexi bacterium]|nr:hypothetical protein [Chloroflexota bacterium]MBV9896884.1 hypothetical protein [Chloroflexota bacterium]